MKMTGPTGGPFQHHWLTSTAMVLFVVLVQTTSIAHAQGQRGNTYCEILWATSDNGQPPTQFNVSWNGFGGTCPTNPGFFNVTEQDIIDAHGPNTVLSEFNGVRQFMASTPSETGGLPGRFDPIEYGKDIFPNGSGLTMFHVAVGIISPDNSPFSSTQINRGSILSWPAGYPVYELISPNCADIFMMQSIYLGRPGDWGAVQSEEELATVVEDGKLVLPEGWTYRVRVLNETVTALGVNDLVSVMTDNIKNTYSRRDEPYDPSLCPPYMNDTAAPITTAPVTTAPVTNAPVTAAPMTNVPTTSAASVIGVAISVVISSVVVMVTLLMN